MDNNDEYIHDSDISEDTGEEIDELSRRKNTEEPEEDIPLAKKVRINPPNPNTKKSSFVWDYFQVENGRDICKVLISSNGKEHEC